MCAASRRAKRRKDIVDYILSQGFQTKDLKHFEHHEASSLFLEGTGSIVFDHQHKLAFACLSPRTDKSLLADLCAIISYKSITFHARDAYVYHTNVLMAIGETFILLCLDAVDNSDRPAVLEAIHSTGEDLITISLEQMGSFAGNMFQVRRCSRNQFWRSPSKVAMPGQLSSSYYCMSAVHD